MGKRVVLIDDITRELGFSDKLVAEFLRGADHNLLSTAHLDTLVASVLRGAIIVGNATPKWSLLPIGLANRVLKSDGTDISWGQVAHGELTGITAFQHHGDNAHEGLLNFGTLASRPDPSISKRFYFATDTGQLFLDQGTYWFEIARQEGATRLASLSEKSHASLTNVTSDQHHAQSHVIATTAGLGADHTTSGLTAGQVLRASGATTALFQALIAADIPVLDAAKITTGRFIAARLLDGTTGYFLKAQGAGADPIYALLTASDIPNLDAAKITTGRFVAARLLDGTSGYFLKAQGVGSDPVYALLTSDDIPSLDAGKITTGTFDLARIPTMDDAHIPNVETLSYGGAFATAQIPSLAASKITSERFGMERMPDGTLGSVLTAKGAGTNPSYDSIVDSCSYTIYVISTTYYARNGQTGAVTSGSVFHTLLNTVLAYADAETVYVKGGAYSLTGTIVMRSNRTLYLDKNAIITLATNTNLPMLKADTLTDFEIIGGIWDGNKTNQNGDNLLYAIWLYNCRRFYLDRIYTKNTKWEGVYVEFCCDGIVLASTAETADREGLSIFGQNGIGTDRPDIRVLGCKAIGNAWDGICPYQTNNITISGCIAYNNGRHGIDIYETNHSIIVDNEVYNNSQAGAGSWDGIFIQSSNNDVVIGNKCYDNQGAKTQRYGINEGGTVPNYNIILGNNCRANQNASSDIVYSGANSIVLWNVGRYTLSSLNASIITAGTFAEARIPHNFTTDITMQANFYPLTNETQSFGTLTNRFLYGYVKYLYGTNIETATASFTSSVNAAAYWSGSSQGITQDVPVAKVGGGTRTLHFVNGLYTGYSDS